MLPESLVLNTNAMVEPVTVAVPPEMLIQDAIAQMNSAQASCILITQQNRPIGIFTQQDIVKLIASAQPISNRPVATAMSHPLKTIQASDLEDALSLYQQMQQQQLCHLSVVDESGQLVGLITHNSLLKAIAATRESQPFKPLNSLYPGQASLGSQVASQTAELRQVEHRWRALLENVRLVVVGLSAYGKVTYANPFFLTLTGYTANEMKDADWFRCFVLPREHPEVSDYFHQLHHQQNVPLQYQNAILTKSGEERIIVWNNTVLYGHNNRVIGTMSIGEDITERFAIDRIKGEFVAMVSHELRTPLTAIHGGIKLLSQGIVPSQSEQGEELLRIVAKSTERLVRLVDDILELERLESGEYPLRKQWLNTQLITRQIAKAFQAIASRANVAIEVSDPGIQLLADSDRLSQVLAKLLDNAIKFSPLGSTVRLAVQVTVEDGRILFSLCDQGKGIPCEQCDKIFERFVQIEHAENSEKGGTGLGLTICRDIIEQHGGNLWVESTPDKGSCFFFNLPGGQPSSNSSNNNMNTTDQVIT